MVVCLLDRRYGTPLSFGPYGGRSATHVEVDEADGANIPRLVFVRDRTLSDLDSIRATVKNGGKACDAPIYWINDEDAERMNEFALRLTKLSEKGNWRTPFKDVVELKKLVLKQLRDLQHASGK